MKLWRKNKERLKRVFIDSVIYVIDKRMENIIHYNKSLLQSHYNDIFSLKSHKSITAIGLLPDYKYAKFN